jgi:hypothetical protein
MLPDNLVLDVPSPQPTTEGKVDPAYLDFSAANKEAHDAAVQKVMEEYKAYEETPERKPSASRTGRPSSSSVSSTARPTPSA